MTPPKLFLVEDNADDIALMRRALRLTGITADVVVARDGREAIALLLDPVEPLPAVVLLDLNLPWIDGFEVLRRLRADPRAHSVPVVVLSSSLRDEDRARAYELGANGYLQKAIDFDRFASEVRGLGARWLGPSALPAPPGSLPPPSAVPSPDALALAFEAAPTGMILTEGGSIVLVNAQIERQFGYARDELVGRSLEMLVPARFRARHARVREVYEAKPEHRMMGAGRELYGLRKDGTEIPIEIGLNPLWTEGRTFVLGSVVDITPRREVERERALLLDQVRALNLELEGRVEERTAALRAALREREVLLQEVHHRVKNNLQIISSMINMQLRKLAESESKQPLEECRSRVETIALIHEKLYQSRDYARVSLGDYIRGLSTSIFAVTSDGSRASLVLELDDVSLAVDKAIPCGLLLNELITNARKHAFPAGTLGTLRITLRKVSASELCLSVADDGVGMRAREAPPRVASFGMQLVGTLVEQLHGTMTVTGTGGTAVDVRFPVEPEP